MTFAYQLWSGVFIFLAAGLAQASAPDGASAARVDASLAAIPLIKAKAYYPSYTPTWTSRIARGASQVGSAILSQTVGRGIRDEIEEAIRQQVGESPDVIKYIPSYGERDRLVHRLLGGVSDRLTDNYSNSSFVAALSFVGNDMFATIIDRAMQKDGNIADPQIRSAWVTRILVPFNRCMAQAKTVFEARSCLESTEVSLPQNVGLALTHQLTRKELAPSLSDDAARASLEKNLDGKYRSCVGSGQDGRKKVQDCVMGAMRSGTLTVSDSSLRQILGRVLKPAQAGRVRAQVWGSYEKCIQASSDPAAFRECIDALTIKAGGAATQERIVSESSVVSSFKEAPERARLAADHRELFEKCASEQKNNGVRVNGTVSTERCETLVENRVTALVVKRTFVDSARANLGKGDAAEKRILADANAKVNSCWSDTLNENGRQACIRAGVMMLAEALTGRVLEKQVPAQTFARHPGWRANLEKDYSACIQKNLPDDIVRSTNRDQVLDHCAADIRKRAGMVVAIEQIRDSVGGRLPPAELKDLLQTLVTGKFQTCLGAAPSNEKLRHCTAVLTRDAGKRAAHTILPAEINKAAQGGKPLSAATRAELDAFLKKSLASLDACLDKRITDARGFQASADAEACFKVATRESALFIGRVQFDNETAAFYGSTPKKWAALRVSVPTRSIRRFLISSRIRRQ